MRRGLFIVLEGCDRAGKSTQTKRILDHLKNKHGDAELLRFPDRTTPVGRMIDAYLTNAQEIDDHALHLLFSANRWELAEKIRKLVDRGTHVIADRYAFSGIAFSVAKGLDTQWCRHPDAGLPRPDLVFFLDLPVEKASLRGSFGEERYERKDFQQKVYDIFTHIREPSWHIVDASKSIADMEQEITSCISKTIEDCHLPPLRSLWTP